MGLIASGGPAVALRLSVTRPSNNDGTRTVRMEITDETSRMQICEIEIEPDAFMDLLTNRQAYASGVFSSKLDRIGKEMQHESENWGHFSRDEFSDAHIDARVEEWRVDNGWDTASWGRNNQADVVVTGRRWVTPQQ